MDLATMLIVRGCYKVLQTIMCSNSRPQVSSSGANGNLNEQGIHVRGVLLAELRLFMVVSPTPWRAIVPLSYSEFKAFEARIWTLYVVPWRNETKRNAMSHVDES